jgi:hypothetical protein
VKALQESGLSQREACKSVHARRRSSSEKPTTKAQRDAIIATRLTQVAQAHPEHGCRRLFADYERDAIDGDEYLNYKAFRRVYRLAADVVARRSFGGSAYAEQRVRSRVGRSTLFTIACSTAARFAV